jgi:hypothetical protein
MGVLRTFYSFKHPFLESIFYSFLGFPDPPNIYVYKGSIGLCLVKCAVRNHVNQDNAFLCGNYIED